MTARMHLLSLLDPACPKIHLPECPLQNALNRMRLIELIFLILSPGQAAEIQLRILRNKFGPNDNFLAIIYLRNI